MGGSEKYLSDPRWQWIAVDGAWFLAGGLLVINHLRERLPSGARILAGACLLALLARAVWAYFDGYQTASGSCDALVLISGIAAGQVFRFFKIRPDGSRSRRALLLIPSLFGVAAILALQAGRHVRGTYRYLDEPRWAWPWHDPNIFGLFMATAVICGIGWLAIPLGNYRRERRAGEGRGRNVSLLLLMAVGLLVCARALLHSYSRGAWLSLAAGLGSLGWEYRWWSRGCAWCRRLPRRVAIPSALAFCGATLLIAGAAVWRPARTEAPVLTRVASMGSADDLSIANRLVAWERGVQIIGDHYLYGVGWNQLRNVYDRFYRPSHVRSPNAIETNDYMGLGGALGVPGLLAFLGFVWLKMDVPGCSATRAHGEPPAPEREAVNAGAATGRAAALALLVGFWFNGALFVFPLGGLFWILLECCDDGRAPEAKS
ncbi:MAG: O-antigen ligase family protein [Verrucomicrobia bacterium]|nr:O-antigen ligase family protein [Verrucomicrobiota bacterium]